MKSLSDLEENYDLELDRIIKEIKKSKARTVLLQFPDGFKPYATAIVDKLEKEIKKIKFLIWFETCFGACDTPKVDSKNIDLVVQFGHKEWNK
jgi:2-(3-amino-3-carboxypropyl)histidine synthase